MQQDGAIGKRRVPTNASQALSSRRRPLRHPRWRFVPWQKTRHL